MIQSRALFIIISTIMIQAPLLCAQEKNRPSHLRPRELLKTPTKHGTLTQTPHQNNHYSYEEWCCAMTLIALSYQKPRYILDLTIPPSTIHPNPTDRKTQGYLAINALISGNQPSVTKSHTTIPKTNQF